jgi:DNA polymerase-1
MTKGEMLLIDGHGLAFRAFYALPETLSASDGTPTNAILGFTNMLLKCLDEMAPDALGLFFDPKGPTRRHELYKEYKEGRRPTPEGFKAQLPLIIEISRAMGIPVFIRDGVEADDYIVATAREASSEGWKVTILSADKDLFQAIDENISVMRPIKGITKFKTYDEKFFTDEYGFSPQSMADYLALLGDNVDNIPGVAGIGEKGAKDLIGSYGNLEKIYENIEQLPKGRRRRLEEGRGSAFKSRDLVVIQETAPENGDGLVLNEPDRESLTPLLQRLGLRKLMKRFGVEGKPAVPSSKREIKPVQKRASGESFEELKDVVDAEISEVGLPEILKEEELALVPRGGDCDIVLVSRSGKFANLNGKSDIDVQKWKEWCAEGVLYIYGLRGFMAENTLPLPDEKRMRDAEVAHYVLHPDRGGMISKTLGFDLPSDLHIGTLLFRIYDAFAEEIEEKDLNSVVNDIDMPLCGTLARLQRNGIYADEEKLRELETEVKRSIAETEAHLKEVAGEEINLNSPKQVAWLLFDKMNLPPIKKTKTGYSTDANVLAKLAALPEPLNEIPEIIIDYREQAKILSGFVEPFLKLAGEGDGRIHSTFDHLATGTGRLSSSDPNVQNMPLFGDLATRFRKCFTPHPDGRIFIAADYSQIELRVLAHLSKEQRLIDAFVTGRDIHLEVAAWVFGLPAEDITPEQRRFAKVVNFGLIYGMSAFGLAQRHDIPRPQAAKMIERYFNVFPRVKEYLHESVEQAKAAGFTRSIFGRIRPLSEVTTIVGRGNSPINRVAVNTPIQSSASDIAKIALTRFDKVVSEEFKDAFTVLQVHDSIVCECAEEDADRLEKRLVEVMEGVDVLSVPVKAETKRGYSLADV